MRSATKAQGAENVNDAVRARLSEDGDDLAAFEERAHEPSVPFERVLRALKQQGRV